MAERTDFQAVLPAEGLDTPSTGIQKEDSETTNRRKRMKALPPIGELDKKGVREAAIDPEARALG